MIEKIDSNAGYFLAGLDYRVAHQYLLRAEVR